MPRWPCRVILVCGTLISLLGFSVLAGWHTRSSLLLQVRPSFAPMAYNTALAFVVCGVALVAASSGLGRGRLVVACGTLAGLFGLVTLVQHLFNIRLHTDLVFFRPHLTVGMNHPTVVAPNAGLCFLLAGLNLVLMGIDRRRRRFSFVIGSLGAVQIAVAWTALFGYLAGISAAYGWGHYTQMAAHTAAGLLVLGTATVAYAWEDEPNAVLGVPRWLPVLVLVGFVTGAFLLFEAFEAEETDRAEATAQAALATVTNEIDLDVKSRFLLLKRMAQRWPTTGLTNRALWEADARMYLSDMTPIARAVEWVDPSLHVRWVVPLEGNEPALGIESGLDATRRRALEAARDQRDIRITETVQLVQGGIGFLAYAPIIHSNRFEGFIVAVFDPQRFFDEILANVVPQHRVSVFEGRKLIYRRGVAVDNRGLAWEREAEIFVHGVGWRVRVAPSAAALREVRSVLPNLVLIGGSVLGVLSAMAVHLALAANRASRKLQSANQELEKDIMARKLMESLLRIREASLRLSQRVGRIGGWELEPATSLLTWSDETYRIFGRTHDNFRGDREGFYTLVHPEDRAPLRALVDRALKEGSSFAMDHRIVLPDGSQRIVHEQAEIVVDPHSGKAKLAGTVQDITERKQAEAERERLIKELQEALARVKTLSGLLPICAGCKKIRDDQGYWNQIESYIAMHSDARFSHGLCPDCARKFFPDDADRI